MSRKPSSKSAKSGKWLTITTLHDDGLISFLIFAMVFTIKSIASLIESSLQDGLTPQPADDLA